MDVVSYAMGEGAGYSKGYSAGYDAGYDEGLDANAYQEGYDAGEAAGYATGYDTGYTEGAASVNSVKDLIDVRGARYLFSYDESSVYINDGQLSNLLKYSDTENVVDMSYMFCGQKDITTIPAIDTHKVISMSYMFRNAFHLKTLPNLDTSNVKNMSNMFSSYNSPPMLDTSSVQTATYMFSQDSTVYAGYTGIRTIPLYDFSKVIRADYMFNYCKYLKSIPALDFKELNYSTGMFNGCFNLEEIHIKDIHYYFDISASTKFTREALVEIIGNLRDLTGSTAKTLKMGATNMAKLTADDIAVATDKNWTVA